VGVELEIEYSYEKEPGNELLNENNDEVTRGDVGASG